MGSAQLGLALPSWSLRTILFISLVLIVFPAHAGAQILGSTPELSFTPDHGASGASIAVQGTGWNAPSEGYCKILGDPVERYSCRIVCQHGTCEPAGNFTVAGVPAGRYSIKVEVDSWGYVPLHFSQWFTVDGEMATSASTQALETPVSTMSLRTTYRRSSLAPTPTTTTGRSTTTTVVESVGNQEHGGLVLAGLVVVAPLVYVFGRRTGRIPAMAKAEMPFRSKPKSHSQYLTKLEKLKAQGSVTDEVYQKLKREYEEKRS